MAASTAGETPNQSTSACSGDSAAAMLCNSTAEGSMLRTRCGRNLTFPPPCGGTGLTPKWRRNATIAKHRHSHLPSYASCVFGQPVKTLLALLARRGREGPQPQHDRAFVSSALLNGMTVRLAPRPKRSLFPTTRPATSLPSVAEKGGTSLRGFVTRRTMKPRCAVAAVITLGVNCKRETLESPAQAADGFK